MEEMEAAPTARANVNRFGVECMISLQAYVWGESCDVESGSGKSSGLRLAKSAPCYYCYTRKQTILQPATATSPKWI